MNTTLLPAFMCNIASRVVWLRQAIEQDPELKKVAHKLARFTAPMSFEEELLSGKMDQVQKVVDRITNNESFQCPKCGSSHFGSRGYKAGDKTYICWRICHDEFGKGCNWTGWWNYETGEYCTLSEEARTCLDTFEKLNRS